MSCRVPLVSAVCALYTGRVALAAMVSVGEWLGAEYTNRGVARILSTRIKNMLVEAAEADMWSLDDVPSWKEMDESLLDESGKMCKRFFSAIFADMETASRASVTAKGEGTPLVVTNTERMRFEEWVDGLVHSFKEPVVAPRQLSMAQSAQMLLDCKAQGMQDVEDLLWFELTKHTGRPAAPGDTDGGCYLGKPSATKGGIAHRKAGEMTYGKMLSAAVEAEDYSRVERWNQSLVDVLGTSEHRYAGLAGMQIMGAMQKLTQRLGTGSHALHYLQLHEDYYTGRGMPNGKVLDADIYQLVLGKTFREQPVVGLSALKQGPPRTGAGSTTSGGTSLASSSLGSSVSSLEKASALEGQLGKVIDAISGLGTKMDEQSEKISTVTRRLQSVEDKVAHQAKGPKCNNCKEFGHIAANCTKKKEE